MRHRLRTRPAWLRALSRPAGRAGASMMTVVLLSGVLVAAVGAGYTATRPLLGDGSAFLAHGHTVAHVNGETGKSDAQAALQFATGKEDVQTVRLPDGQLAIVNKTTGVVTFLNSATLTVDANTHEPIHRRDPAGKIEPVATKSAGYLVDDKLGTVEKIAVPGQRSDPVKIPGTIVSTVPSGDSVWVLTDKGDIVEVVDGRAARTFRVGKALAGLTVADSHPVAVAAEDGTAYIVDGEHPRDIGRLGVSGPHLVLGSWRGAGRYVVAVDRDTGQVGVLDPRTEHGLRLDLKATAPRPDYDAPVALGTWVYVPDYSGPYLWRINVAKGTADDKPLEVPGESGRPFDLMVSGDRVWANSQYVQRALVVDAHGHESRADKGSRPEVTDPDAKQGPPPGPEAQPGTGQPAPPDGAAPGQPAEQSGPTVTVPSFPRGTPYQQACDALRKLTLVCRAVVAGDEAGLRSGDVIDTDPAAGRQVPERSRVVVRYVGPLRTPAVIGVWYQTACDRIKAAKLTCAASPAPDAALAPDQLGRVSTQDPAPTDTIAKGGTVSITYRDSIALPNLTDQMFAAACEQMKTTYRMECVAERGDPPPAGKQGQVYQQDPPAGTVVKMRSKVTVRYYRGDSTPGPVVGLDIFSACGTIQGMGLRCVPAEGNCAWSKHAVGEVSDQQPPAGTTVAVGASVTLTFYSDKCPVPSIPGGQDVLAACATIGAAGFACNQAHVLYPTPNVVVGQDPPGGVLQLGSPVTIRFSPWATVSTALGTAYPVGTPIPGGRLIYKYTCNAGGGRCRGLDSNMFYSAATKDLICPSGKPCIDPDFNGTPYAVLMPCGSALGQTMVWRTWNAGSPRYYDIRNTPVGAGKPRVPPEGDSELLGCVW